MWIHGKFNEALPEKENFYSHLNMEDITDVDYKKRLQRFWNENFKWIIWIISSNLYIIASSCIWELLQYASWNITRPCSFCTSPGLAWHRVLKKTKVKFDQWTDIDMLAMVEEVVRGETCHAIH